MIIIIPLAGLLFFLSYFFSLRSYINFGSIGLMILGALVQPLATAVSLTLLLALFGEVNPAMAAIDSGLQFQSSTRVFGFAALFISTPIAMFCAIGAIGSIQTSKVVLVSTNKQAAFDTMVKQVTASVVGFAVIGALILILASAVS